MGSLDIPPAHTPQWVVPVHSACLSIAFLLWSATYVLMTRRSLATKSYGMPLLALAVNVSWEIVNLFYVCEMPLEKVGLAMWLLFDVGLVYTTVQFGPNDWRSSNPWVGRNIGWILAALTAGGGFGHWAFSAWWLAEPGRGYGSGSKAGKWWGGREGYDTTELAFWSSGVSQLILSYGSLSMLLARGHSGGTGYDIWLSRTLGTIVASYVVVLARSTWLFCELSLPASLGFGSCMRCRVPVRASPRSPDRAGAPRWKSHLQP